MLYLSKICAGQTITINLNIKCRKCRTINKLIKEIIKNSYLVHTTLFDEYKIQLF